MTELEWERCLELEPMLRFLAGRVSLRKFQLFAVACCRRYWELFCPQPSRQIVNTAERFADGIGTVAELEAAIGTPVERIPREVSYRGAICSNQAATQTARCHGAYAAVWAWAEAAASSALYAYRFHYEHFDEEAVDEFRHSFAPHPERYQQIALLYDVVGNPFRSVVVDPSWRTTTVLTMARRMYQTRDFSAMPILADALQDAGCDSDDILDHCRDTSVPHTRGCWVVDLVLGKG